MFKYIKGIVTEKKDNYIVIENMNIGFKVFSSREAFNKAVLNDTTKVFIYNNVREDEFSLYGFHTEEELDIFNLLILVSGVGPKTALVTLSSLLPSEIVSAILAEDYKTLTKAPGIGKKTAERIILELRDRVEKLDFDFEEAEVVVASNKEKDHAVETLEHLGYEYFEIREVLKDLDVEGLSEGEIVKLVLRSFS